MKSKVFLFMLFFCFLNAFADTIVLNKGKTTYIQEVNFVLAEGENILGPVELNPLNTVEILNFQINNAQVIDYIYEPSSLNWKETFLGKEVIISSEGRIIKGKVISIKNDFITLETKNGVVVTPVPKNGGKIEIRKSYSSSVSPKVTFKVLSKVSGETKIKISYPIKGIYWKIRYLYDGKNLKTFLQIDNNTAITFASIDIFIKPLNKKLKKVFLPANSKKIISIKLTKDKMPNGIVYIYENGIFKGIGKLKRGKIIK